MICKFISALIPYRITEVLLQKIHCHYAHKIFTPLCFMWGGCLPINEIKVVHNKSKNLTCISYPMRDVHSCNPKVNLCMLHWVPDGSVLSFGQCTHEKDERNHYLYTNGLVRLFFHSSWWLKNKKVERKLKTKRTN